MGGSLFVISVIFNVLKLCRQTSKMIGYSIRTGGNNMEDLQKIYPRTGDTQTVYLKNVVTKPNIEIGDYTMYHDFVHGPAEFEQNNVLYHYPINHAKLRIGKFCSIACGVKFLFNSANHTLASLSTYLFPLFFEKRLF